MVTLNPAISLPSQLLRGSQIVSSSEGNILPVPSPLSSNQAITFKANAIYFGRTSNLKKAKRIDGQLQGLQEKAALKATDQTTLDAVRQLFNNIKEVPLEVEHEDKKIAIDNVLSIKELKKHPKQVQDKALAKLQLAVRARIGATEYKARRVTLNGQEYTIHNPFVEIKAQYKAADIDAAFKLLESKGVFDVHTDPKTGLIRTSETANTLMTRQWFTDGSKNGLIQRDKDPDNWKRVVLIHAACINMDQDAESPKKDDGQTLLLPSAQTAIGKTVANPNWYRKDRNHNLQGVFHIFQPGSVEFDDKGVPIVGKIRLDNDWFNQKRLESQALILADMVDTLRVGLVDHQSWGFSPEFLDSGQAYELVKKAIVDLARYLKAVNTDPKTGKFDFKAPSASSWEEAPFKRGMASDTADTVLAFEKLQDLMFNAQYDRIPEIKQLRKDLKRLPEAEVLKNPKELRQFIKAGRSKIQKWVVDRIEAGKLPMQNPQRKPDTSLMLLASSDYRFYPNNLTEDARIRLKLVKAMKAKLLGTYGMRRYNQFEKDGTSLYDSYLNTNYHMPAALRNALAGGKAASGKDFGSGDSGGVEGMAERQQLANYENSAQWCLGVSAALMALAKAKTDLLTGKSSLTKSERKLLDKINNELNDFTSRNLGLVVAPMNPGKSVIRSDGSQSNKACVMEAFEVTTDVNGEQKFHPGAHPLAWGQSQLYAGLKRTYQAHLLEEKLLG